MGGNEDATGDRKRSRPEITERMAMWGLQGAGRKQMAHSDWQPESVIKGLFMEVWVGLGPGGHWEQWGVAVTLGIEEDGRVVTNTRGRAVSFGRG